MATDSFIPDPNIMAAQDSVLLPPEPELISDEEALKLVNDTFQDYDHGRKPFERQWYRNILFLLGNQWIIWDTLENKWRKKRLADWVPTPVTNKFAASGQRLVSVLARIEPNWNYIPHSESEQDISAAETCRKVEPIIAEENELSGIRESAAPWIIYTGNAYLMSGVEPVMGKPQPSIMDASMMMQPEVIDYKLYTDVLAPFEVYLDQTVERFKDQTKILVVNRRSREYVQNLWDVDIDELDVAPNIHYQESIGYVTSSPEITGFLASLSRIKRITVKRLFHKPSKKYPKGLYIVVAGSRILEKKPLPETMEGEAFIPISSIKFDSIPGAAFGRTPMDDIVHKQIQRNKIESLIELIALRMGSPIWLMPEGTVVRNFSGAPGAIVTYNLIGDKASKPDRIPGEQIPTSIVQFLGQIDKDIEELVATFEALKGQAPYSGAPGIVIEQLIEQGMTRFGPSLRNIAEGYRLWMKHQLEFFRRYGIAEKTAMKSGEGSKWEAIKFKGADIAGAVDVQIESDSTVPRSSQIEVAKILEAVNVGLIDIEDPVVKQQVLRKLKIQDLKDDNESDMRSAVQENEKLTQGIPVPVTPFIDNHDIHIYQHRKFANSDVGQQPEIRSLIVQHITQHNMLKDAEMNPGLVVGQEQGLSPQGSGITKNIGKGGKQALAPGKGADATLPPNIL